MTKLQVILMAQVAKGTSSKGQKYLLDSLPERN